MRARVGKIKTPAKVAQYMSWRGLKCIRGHCDRHHRQGVWLLDVDTKTVTQVRPSCKTSKKVLIQVASMTGAEEEVVVLSHPLSLIQPVSWQDSLPVSTVTTESVGQPTTPTGEQTIDSSIDLSFAHPTATSSPKPMDTTYDILMANLDPSTVSFVLQKVTIEEGTIFSEGPSEQGATSQNSDFLMQTDGQQDSISIREVLDVIDNVQMDELVTPAVGG